MCFQSPSTCTCKYIINETYVVVWDRNWLLFHQVFSPSLSFTGESDVHVFNSVWALRSVAAKRTACQLIHVLEICWLYVCNGIPFWDCNTEEEETLPLPPLPSPTPPLPSSTLPLPTPHPPNPSLHSSSLPHLSLFHSPLSPPFSCCDYTPSHTINSPSPLNSLHLRMQCR